MAQRPLRASDGRELNMVGLHDFRGRSLLTLGMRLGRARVRKVGDGGRREGFRELEDELVVQSRLGLASLGGCSEGEVLQGGRKDAVASCGYRQRVGRHLDGRTVVDLRRVGRERSHKIGARRELDMRGPRRDEDAERRMEGERRGRLRTFQD